MKKEHLIALILVSFFGSCAHSPKVPELRVGLVNFVAGQVFISGPSGKEVQAKPGDPLAGKMSVRTVGEASLCEIYFDDTAVKVSGNSVLAVDTVLYGKGLSESTGLVLKKGESFVRAPKLLKGSSFTIKTSTAVAAVRGTEFFVSAAGSSTTVSCLSGKVEVAGKNGTADSAVVISGDEASVAKTTSDPDKKALSENEKKTLTAKSHVEPRTAGNTDTLEKIRSCDADTIKRLKDRLNSFLKERSVAGTSAPAVSVPEADKNEESLPVTEKAAALPLAEKTADVSPVRENPMMIPSMRMMFPAGDLSAADKNVRHIEVLAPARVQQRKTVPGGQTVPPYATNPYFFE